MTTDLRHALERAALQTPTLVRLANEAREVNAAIPSIATCDDAEALALGRDEAKAELERIERLRDELHAAIDAWLDPSTSAYARFFDACRGRLGALCPR